MNQLVINNPSAAKLRQAADLLDNIERQQSEVAALLNSEVSMENIPSVRVNRPKAPTSGTRTVTTKTGQVRHISPEGLERIKAAQRRRHRKNKILQKQQAAAPAATNGTPAPAPAAPAPVATPAPTPAPVTAAPTAAPTPAPVVTEAPKAEVKTEPKAEAKTEQKTETPKGTNAVAKK